MKCNLDFECGWFAGVGIEFDSWKVRANIQLHAHSRAIVGLPLPTSLDHGKIRFVRRLATSAHLSDRFISASGRLIWQSQDF